MENIIGYLILIGGISFIVYTVVDVLKGKQYTHAEKTNYLGLISFLPITGSFIYLLALKKPYRFKK